MHAFKKIKLLWCARDKG